MSSGEMSSGTANSNDVNHPGTANSNDVNSNDVNSSIDHVVIVGAGIAGLTAAHELLDRGVQVTIYERNSVAGGFARSERTKYGVPTEHSWRGYAPFYWNTFDMLKRIPRYDHNGDISHGTVYDNLSTPLEFDMSHDHIKSSYRGYTVKDAIIVIFYLLNVVLSDKRRTQYASESFMDIVHSKLSASGKSKVLGFLGPGLGLDNERASMFHVSKFFESALSPHKHFHTKTFFNERTGETTVYTYKHHAFQPWHTMEEPTSEAWIDHWVTHLRKLGANFVFDSTLTDIVQSSDNSGTIDHLVINNVMVYADAYIITVSPFVLDEIIENRPHLKNMSELMKIAPLTKEGPHYQVSFRIGFDKSMMLSGRVPGIILPDSEFGITFYSQNQTFRNDVHLGTLEDGTPITGLFSGTVCNMVVPGKLYDLPAYQLSKDQLKREILSQIGRSQEFQEHVKKNNNGKSFSDFKIVHFEIWKEFQESVDKDLNDQDIDTLLLDNGEKWVTTLETYPHRPKQKADRYTDNLFLAGAWTNTSISIWSMEGAVESGKVAAKGVLDSLKFDMRGLPIDINDNLHDIFIHVHDSPNYIKPFQKADNTLLKYGLPSVLVIIIAVIGMSIFYYANKYIL